MINQCLFVGRVTKVEGSDTFMIELSVEREHDKVVDVIPLYLNEVLSERIKPVLKEGIMLAVKARLQKHPEGILVPIVERITYL